MKINFLGDSITAGARLSSPEEKYSAVLCKMLGATENNYGISATRIARQRIPSADVGFDRDFLSRVGSMDKTADFNFVFGGTNDYGHGDAPLGEATDRTPYTFCCAVNMITEDLAETFGKNKICFVLPVPRYNEDDVHGDNGCKKEGGKTLSEYREAIKAVAAKQGVDVLDLSDLFPRPQASAPDEFTADGLHPNAKGHRFIAERMYAYLTKKLNLQK